MSKELQVLCARGEETRAESYVRELLGKTLLPLGSPVLHRVQEAHMTLHHIPGKPRAGVIAQPRPDVLYGYSGLGAEVKAFSEAQVETHAKCYEGAMEGPAATTRDTRLPFLLADFKCTWGDSLHVAKNQCVGALGASLNAVARLNDMLKSSNRAQLVEEFVYGMIANEEDARLHVAWKEGPTEYRVQEVERFNLLRPEEFIKLQKQILNILDWGSKDRLDQARNALNSLGDGEPDDRDDTTEEKTPRSVARDPKRKLTVDHGGSDGEESQPSLLQSTGLTRRKPCQESQEN
ncbi:hypothetical protein JX265_005557 [Neoarthrinium moseri]|uniref:DUF7924 domain-containing protein n=1 Tax=Neoarthrinium moseri TaxID=1658444 RepID=A0A9P9WP78_9PEZI|nr:hypothetical protein JX265_005557 [Neoarthrinium moseri]